MGLCKCPKKKVTNLFCYEHRVNVCQNCLVKHHSKCIVQSYLQWLQDSDYNPNCILCGDKLISEECVRLVCLHIFHWKCLERRCRRLPSTTAPAGYTCPVCNDPIFPLANVAVPVADQLRDKLSTVNWARHALGLPLVSDGDSKQLDDEEEDTVDKNECTPMINSTNNHLEKSNSKTRRDKDDLVLYLDEPVYSRPEETAQVPRRAMSNLLNLNMLSEEDDKKNIKRIRPISIFSRWLKFFGRRIGHFGRQKYGKCKLIIMGILVVFIICIVFSILGRIATEDDPAFDPLHNPHVHLKDDSAFIKNVQ